MRKAQSGRQSKTGPSITGLRYLSASARMGWHANFKYAQVASRRHGLGAAATKSVDIWVFMVVISFVFYNRTIIVISARMMPVTITPFSPTKALYAAIHQSLPRGCPEPFRNQENSERCVELRFDCKVEPQEKASDFSLLVSPRHSAPRQGADGGIPIRQAGRADAGHCQVFFTGLETGGNGRTNDGYAETHKGFLDVITVVVGHSENLLWESCISSQIVGG